MFQAVLYRNRETNLKSNSICNRFQCLSLTKYFSKYLHLVSSIIFLSIANALSNYYIMIICRMLQYEESFCYLHQIETDVHKSSDVISTKTFQAMNGRFSPSQYDNVIFILINDGIDPSFLLMSL